LYKTHFYLAKIVAVRKVRKGLDFANADIVHVMELAKNCEESAKLV